MKSARLKSMTLMHLSIYCKFFFKFSSKAEQKRRIRTEYRPDSIYPEYNSS